MDFYYIILILVGFITGFIGAFVGVGGGIFLMLIFIFFTEEQNFNEFENTRIIIANTAIILLGVQLIAGIKRVVSKKIYIGNAIVVAIPAVIIALLISYFLINFEIISFTIFKIIFILFVLYSSYVLATNKERRIFEVCHRGGIRKNTRNLFAGFLSGTATSFTGSDSGIFIVPVLNRYCDIDIRRAINIYNTSFIFILLTIVGLYAFPAKGIESEAYFGYINVSYTSPMLIGACLAAIPGYALFSKIKFNYFVYPLIFLFVVSAIRILFLDFIFPLY